MTYKHLKTGTKFVPYKSGRTTTGIWIGGKVGSGKFFSSKQSLSRKGRTVFKKDAYKVNGKVYYDTSNRRRSGQRYRAYNKTHKTSSSSARRTRPRSKIRSFFGF